MGTASKKEQKSKAQKLLAAQSASKKSKTKKKAVVRAEKKNYAPLVTEEEFVKVRNIVAKMNVVTPHTLSERAKVTVSLARKIMTHLATEGVLQQIVQMGSLKVFRNVSRNKQPTK